MNYKEGFKYISIIQLFFIFTSCGLHSGLESCKEEFLKSKDQLDSVSYLFLNQNTLLAISRRDYKWTTIDRFINFFTPIKTEYNIIGKSKYNNTFKVEVEGEENIFFNQNHENIKSGNKTLKNFLDSQNISYELFNLARKVLFENDYYRIDSDPTDSAILIYIGKLDGILYSTKKGIEINNPRYEELIPIGENWYYFRTEMM